MDKTDLTQYSSCELSLLVFNDKGLYNMRHEVGFIELLQDYYNFTETQKEILKQDLIDDLEEESKGHEY